MIRQAPHNAASERYRAPAANRQRGMDSVRKNANEVYDGKCFRKGGNFFRTLVNLFRKAILRKCSFLRFGVGAVFSRSSLGRQSVE